MENERPKRKYTKIFPTRYEIELGYTKEEAAQILGIDTQSLYQAAKRKGFKALKEVIDNKVKERENK